MEQVLTRGEPPRLAFPRESCLQHYGRLETSVVGSCFVLPPPQLFLEEWLRRKMADCGFMVTLEPTAFRQALYFWRHLGKTWDLFDVDLRWSLCFADRHFG